ncbi:uncharacterized protein BXZ73DRAFT_96400 [Epithele typhae]|uniref:uncharacterized protein n=1 Tax=Epithele typhae TaxID=378194 RepID=UPI002007D642|nr:uncharacterized protein BXZ73DRAFT_96400 [Epithele typhae]KAH9945410.1 hypothetical protein BXZ73DRAFT_96400 [Epithele typhae]
MATVIAAVAQLLHRDRPTTPYRRASKFKSGDASPAHSGFGSPFEPSAVARRSTSRPLTPLESRPSANCHATRLDDVSLLVDLDTLEDDAFCCPGNCSHFNCSTPSLIYSSTNSSPTFSSPKILYSPTSPPLSDRHDDPSSSSSGIALSCGTCLLPLPELKADTNTIAQRRGVRDLPALRPINIQTKVNTTSRLLSPRSPLSPSDIASGFAQRFVGFIRFSARPESTTASPSPVAREYEEDPFGRVAGPFIDDGYSDDTPFKARYLPDLNDLSVYQHLSQLPDGAHFRPETCPKHGKARLYIGVSNALPPPLASSAFASRSPPLATPPVPSGNRSKSASSPSHRPPPPRKTSLPILQAAVQVDVDPPLSTSLPTPTIRAASVSPPPRRPPTPPTSVLFTHHVPSPPLQDPLRPARPPTPTSNVYLNFFIGGGGSTSPVAHQNPHLRPLLLIERAAARESAETEVDVRAASPPPPPSPPLAPGLRPLVLPQRVHAHAHAPPERFFARRAQRTPGRAPRATTFPFGSPAGAAAAGLEAGTGTGRGHTSLAGVPSASASAFDVGLGRSVGAEAEGPCAEAETRVRTERDPGERGADGLPVSAAALGMGQPLGAGGGSGGGDVSAGADEQSPQKLDGLLTLLGASGVLKAALAGEGSRAGFTLDGTLMRPERCSESSAPGATVGQEGSEESEELSQNMEDLLQLLTCTGVIEGAVVAETSASVG